VLLVPKKKAPHPLKEKEEIEYDTIVGRSTKGLPKRGILFVSNPAIQERIQELRIKPGTKIGFVSYQTDHHFKYVAAPWFTPEKYVSRPKGQKVSDPRFFNQFAKTGFGSMIEILALKAIVRTKTNTANYHFQGTMDDNPLREAHYRGRGIDFSESPTVRDVIKKTREHIIQGYRKWKARRRR
jgi:hypothetical protein